MITVGIMAASILGLLSDYGELAVTYRLVFSVPFIIIGIQVPLFWFYFKNESPEYYKVTENVDKEYETYKLIYRNTSEINHENFRRELKSDSVSSADYNLLMDMSSSKSILALFRPPFLRSLIIGCILSLLQQLTGINAVIFYSSRIFSKDRPEQEDELTYGTYGTLLVGIVN
jgi:hypothetical protein